LRLILKKALRKVSGIITNFIERLWILSHKRVETSASVFLVGTPRSGTTWITEIIESLGNYRVIFEPFHTGFYPIAERFLRRSFLIEPVYRPYLPITDKDYGLKNMLT